MKITIWTVLIILGFGLMVLFVVTEDKKDKYHLRYNLGMLGMCLLWIGYAGSILQVKEDMKIYNIEEEKVYELIEIKDGQYYAEDANGYISIVIKNSRDKLEVKSWPKEDVLFTIKEGAEQKQVLEENAVEGTDEKKENINKEKEQNVGPVRKIVVPKTWNTAMVLTNSYETDSWIQISLEENNGPYKVNTKTKILQEYIQRFVEEGYVLFRNGYKEDKELFNIYAVAMSEYEVEVNESTKEIYLTSDVWKNINNRNVTNEEVNVNVA